MFTRRQAKQEWDSPNVRHIPERNSQRHRNTKMSMNTLLFWLWWIFRFFGESLYTHATSFSAGMRPVQPCPLPPLPDDPLTSLPWFGVSPSLSAAVAESLFLHVESERNSAGFFPPPKGIFSIFILTFRMLDPHHIAAEEMPPCVC